jgi:hypothetical protein
LVNKLFVFLIILLAGRYYGNEFIAILAFYFPSLMILQNVFSIGMSNKYIQLLTIKGRRNFDLVFFYTWLFFAVALFFLVTLVYIYIFNSFFWFFPYLFSGLMLGFIVLFSNKLIVNKMYLSYFLSNAGWKILSILLFFLGDLKFDLFLFATVFFIICAFLFLIREIKLFSPKNKFHYNNIKKEIQDSGILKVAPLFLNLLFSFVAMFLNRFLLLEKEGGESSDVNTILILPGMFLLFYTMYFKFFIPKAYELLNRSIEEYKASPIFFYTCKFMVPFSMLSYYGCIVFYYVYSISYLEYGYYAYCLLLLYFFYIFYAYLNDVIIFYDNGKTILVINVINFLLTIMLAKIGYNIFSNHYVLIHFIGINILSIVITIFRGRRFLDKKKLAIFLKSLLILLGFVLFNMLDFKLGVLYTVFAILYSYIDSVKLIKLLIK